MGQTLMSGCRPGAKPPMESPSERLKGTSLAPTTVTEAALSARKAATSMPMKEVPTMTTFRPLEAETMALASDGVRRICGTYRFYRTG